MALVDEPVVRDGLPPGPDRPGWWQALAWALRPTWLLRECERRYGDIFSLRGVGAEPSDVYVYVSDPAAIKAIATGDREALKAGAARGELFEPVFGAHSILLIDGAEHLRQRKLLLPPFHGERMKSYGDLIRAETDRRMRTWPRDEPFALQEEFQQITLDVILRAVFGFDTGPALDDARKHIQQFILLLASPAAMVPALRDTFSPAKSWTPAGRARTRVRQALYALIAERRTDPHLEGRDDVLSLLIQARDEDGRPMTDDELRDELISLLLAGHETTATAMAWAIELLLCHPEELATLKADLPNGDERLSAVIHETMRLRPPVPFFDRRVCEPVEVLGHRIPVGTILACNVVSAQRRADVYPEPLAFRPQRFVDGHGRVGTDYAWIPFGGGIRRCLGAAFALYEMRIVLRMVLERLELQAVDPQPGRYARRAIVLGPRSEAKVRIVEG